MPELCRFYGVVVTMFFEDAGQHNTPHFHARYGTDSASFSLEGDLLAGSLPPKQTKLVVAWAALRRQELEENWFSRKAGGHAFESNPFSP